jgi:hypothetical protein
VILALGSSIWVIISRHDHHPPPPPPTLSPTPTHSAPPTSPPTSSPSPAPSSTGFTATVDWTDDGGSTLLKAYDGPNSHVSHGAYPKGESITVMCQSAGRGLTVGPNYHGPSPNSTTWYQLDNGWWVPAVYVNVEDAAVPTCP